MLTCPLKMLVAGSCPIATNTPLVLYSIVLPSSVLFIFTALTVSSPNISSTVAFHITFIFSSAKSLSCKICSALSLSLLWIRVTLDAILLRYRASSTALLPPPTTTTS